MTDQASAMADLRSELEALRNDKGMLLLRNQSLEEELQKEKQLLASHHKHHAISLHHAHRHDMSCPFHHAWWLVDKSVDYEVGPYQLTTLYRLCSTTPPPLLYGANW
jgi:hypothetical protein